MGDERALTHGYDDHKGSAREWSAHMWSSIPEDPIRWSTSMVRQQHSGFTGMLCGIAMRPSVTKETHDRSDWIQRSITSHPRDVGAAGQRVDLAAQGRLVPSSAENVRSQDPPQEIDPADRFCRILRNRRDRGQQAGQDSN